MALGGGPGGLAVRSATGAPPIGAGDTLYALDRGPAGISAVPVARVSGPAPDPATFPPVEPLADPGDPGGVFVLTAPE